MEKEENHKLLSPESADENYVYYIDKSIPFSDNVIFKDDTKCLLNVRKIYTNNVYFGVSFTTFDSTYGIHHQFACKDRPIGVLSVVENKDEFISIFRDKLDSHTAKKDIVKTEEIFYQLPYRVFYSYDKDGLYQHTTYYLEDGRVIRGLYGAVNEKHLQNLLIAYNGFATLGPPTKKEVISYYEDKMTSYANNQISVSTDYSKIIIEHSTQYEKEWSDIKRRKLWVKKHQ